MDARLLSSIGLGFGTQRESPIPPSTSRGQKSVSQNVHEQKKNKGKTHGIQSQGELNGTFWMSVRGVDLVNFFFARLDMDNVEILELDYWRRGRARTGRGTGEERASARV